MAQIKITPEDYLVSALKEVAEAIPVAVKAERFNLARRLLNLVEELNDAKNTRERDAK